jgi:hybrid cluster-associated redox disulfide protein
MAAIKKVSKKKEIKAKIAKNMPINEIVRNYPQTMEVFMKYGLHCIGCAAAQFEDLEAGALAHGIDVDKLVVDLNKAVESIDEPKSDSHEDSCGCCSSSEQKEMPKKKSLFSSIFKR